MRYNIKRLPYGKGFTYRYLNGRTVKNSSIKSWIKKLAIPPAWTNVKIYLDRDAKVHATGRDSKGKKQYIYNKRWSEEASKRKFDRIIRFAAKLEKMRRVTARHLQRAEIDVTKTLACMTRMLDEAFFRPGHTNYTRNNNTYGLTTLRSRHMTVKDDSIEFNYVGKSQKKQNRVINDNKIKEILLKLDEMPGYELFDITLPDNQRYKVTAKDLNDYISEIMGEDFSAKDFRTWAGTLLMSITLDGLNTKDSTRDKNVIKAVKVVAGELGNTPEVARNNYIHPEIINQYLNGKTIRYFQNQLKNIDSQYFSFEEKATLRLIKTKIKKYAREINK